MFTYPLQRLTLLAYLRETLRFYGCGFQRFFLLFLGLAVLFFGVSTFLGETMSYDLTTPVKASSSMYSSSQVVQGAGYLNLNLKVWSLLFIFVSYFIGVLTLYAVNSTEGKGQINFNLLQIRQRFLILCGLFFALLALVALFLAAFMVLAYFWNPHLSVITFLPITLFVVVRFSPILPEVIWGGKGLVASFRQVWVLTRGHFFFILVRGFMIALVSYVGLHLVQWLFSLLSPGQGGSAAALSSFISLLVTYLWTIPLDAAAHLLVWRQLHIDKVEA